MQYVDVTLNDMYLAMVSVDLHNT